MNLTYKDKISVADYKNLLIDCGWKILSDKQLQKSLDNSMVVISAYDSNLAVGMARIVGDFSTHGLLVDVMVLKEYRHLGVGRTLISMIINNIKASLDDGEEFLIELLPASGKREFYQKCGFKYKPEDMDGMYLWIKNTD